MGSVTKPPVEKLIIITPDGEEYDLTTESELGRWVLDPIGWGLPPIEYFSQKGPFQHGVSVRDYRLQSRSVQFVLRVQGCSRDEYWAKRSALLDAIRPNRSVVSLSGQWIARSQSLYQEWLSSKLTGLVEFNGKLYGYASGIGDYAVIWNQSDSVSNVALALEGMHCSIVYDDGAGEDLYFGSESNGRLYRYDPPNLTVCAATLGGQTDIYDVVYFNCPVVGAHIFAGTGHGGRLFYYNEVPATGWIQVCAQLGAETEILSLAVFDDGGGDDLYGGTQPNGKLYRYNSAGAAWVQVCAQLNAQTKIYSLCVYNGRLYGGTGPSGRLFRLNLAGNAWEQVAPQYGAQTDIYKLIVYQGRLYGTTGPNGKLLRWNNSDAWEEVAGQYSDEPRVVSAVVYNNRLFAGTQLLLVTQKCLLLEYIQRQNELKLPCFTLRRILSDGSIRDMCVHIQKGPEFTTDRQRWDEHAFMEALRFWSPDPSIYDPEEQAGPSYTMAAGNVNESQNLTYAGTWREHPVMVITGPLDYIVIRNEDTGEFIQIDYELPSGEYIYIDLTPGNQIVEHRIAVADIGTNIIGAITPDSDLQSFHLAPDPEATGGVNEITISGENSDGVNTDFEISYYNRYIGI